MREESLLLDSLSAFARLLPAEYDVEMVLAELVDSVTAIFDLSGSGVSLAENGRLRFVAAVNTSSGELERVQERLQLGPCRDAFDTGEVVRVRDVRETGGPWAEFSAAAVELHVAGVAGIPMRLADETIGALNLYAGEPRDWSDADIAWARVLADMATGYIVNASKLRQQQQLNEQLQHALESRVVIEQAKGIIAQDRGLGVGEAYRLMRRHARSHNCSMRAVAEAVVNVGLRL